MHRPAIGLSIACWPQWSPPVTGGNTPNFLDGHGYFFEPQWHPGDVT